MRISDTFFKKADMDFLFFCLSVRFPVCFLICLSVFLSVRQLKQTAIKRNWAEARGDGMPFRSGCSDGLYMFADVRARLRSRCVKEMESHGDKPDEIESRQNRRPCSRALAQFPFIAVCFS
jgi:hypothetical protein